MGLSFQRFLRGMGLKLTMIPRSPYEHLLRLPRFRETTVELLGARFRVADPLSFYHSYREIFLEGIYEFKSSVQRPRIVDCGANYGSSVVYFKSLYPDSCITAVEADPRIFGLLESNLERRGYTDITLLQGAITTESTPLRFYQEGADGGRLHPIEGCLDVVEVPPIALDDLLAEPVNFLKVDIEGAEVEVICGAQNLGNVAQMFIEYHCFKNSPQRLDVLLRALSEAGFRYYIHHQYCAYRPLLEERVMLGQDLKLAIFARKIP